MKALQYQKQAVLSKIYSDNVYLPIWWISFVIVAAVGLDAVVEPIAGSITDRFRSACGRRRPFIFVGCLVASGLSLMLYMPCVFFSCVSTKAADAATNFTAAAYACVGESDAHPNATSMIAAAFESPALGVADDSRVHPAYYFLITYVLYNIGHDVASVPLEALGTELASVSKDRDSLYLFVALCTVIGVWAGLSLPGALQYFAPSVGRVNANLVFAVVFSSLFICGSWLAVLFLRERVEVGSREVCCSFQANREEEQARADAAAACYRQLLAEKEAAAPDAATAAAVVAQVEEKDHDTAEEAAEGGTAEGGTAEGGTAEGGTERSRSSGGDAPRFETTIENSAFVPSLLQCFKNPLFLIFFTSQVILALGAEVQNTVLPYIVDYVIEPSTMATPMSPDVIFALLAGVGLLAETISVPVWYAAARRFGRIRTCASRVPFLPRARAFVVLIRSFVRFSHRCSSSAPIRPDPPRTAAGTSSSSSEGAFSSCSRSSSYGTRSSLLSLSSPCMVLRSAASGCTGHLSATLSNMTSSSPESGARHSTMHLST